MVIVGSVGSGKATDIWSSRLLDGPQQAGSRHEMDRPKLDYA